VYTVNFNIYETVHTYACRENLLNESKIRHDHMILSFAYDAGKTAMLYSYSEYINVVLVLKWSHMLLKFTAPVFIINNHLKRL